MSEKRLIDANVLIKKLQEAVAHKGMGAAIAGILIRYIEKLPTVDAVEVVRCKDCKKVNVGGLSLYCSLTGMPMDEDDFCSYGERKTE